ncbi:MAG: NADP-dependent phosphogluconate dehydrogenase [Chitinophagaceae bacterium]
MNNNYQFGMIGLGIMGRNFLLNMADHGYKVIGFDKDNQKTTALEAAATAGTTVKGTGTLKEMVDMLETPRKIMMLVPAGKPVDDVIESLLPLVQAGDIIIDGGNSHYTDTLRRVAYLQGKNLHFTGMGVSGGEEGARKGPSIMPGGDAEAYPHIKPMLEAVSAKVNNEPCVAYMGKGAAGHYVKMVHNGIEYAIMQLISETYDLLHRGLGLNNDELHEVFKQWNGGEMQSFLIEITANIFKQQDDKTGNRLVDMILDKAGSKGTGKWTSQDAMNLPAPIPVIDMAVSMRNISSFKEERMVAAGLYNPIVKPITANREVVIKQVHDALYFATIICYAQGLAMLHSASEELDMQIPLADVVKIWRGGCIIRSGLLETFYKAQKKNRQLPNILTDKAVAKLVKKKEKNLRAILKTCLQSKIPAGALMSALSYFEAYTSAIMPVNLIQAQRDYFGAHTYQRTDMEGTFHTEWNHES